jgi:hypothetical protein
MNRVALGLRGSSTMRQYVPEIASTAQPRRRWWRRPIVILLFVLLLIAGIPLGAFFYFASEAERVLQAAIAETDALDPDWRLEDLLAKREAIPDKANASLVILAAHRQLAQADLSKPIFQELDELGDFPPAVLTDKQTAALRAEFKLLEPALREARKLVGYENGQFRIIYELDFAKTNMDELFKVRQMAASLNYDAILLSQDLDSASAWTSSKALLHSNRCIGDEQLISFLLRVAIRALALGSIERTLARGAIPAAPLVDLQRSLRTDIDQPILYAALRGERALIYRTMTAFVRGELSTVSTLTTENSSHITEFFARHIELKRTLAVDLTLLNQAVAITKLPTQQQETAWQKLEVEASKAPPLSKMLIPAIGKVGRANQRTQTQLRCAMTALAVERYRLGHARWPATLTDVVNARLIDSVPIDPYDAKPLRYRQTKDGVVIFSVGAEGNYDGTALDNGPAPRTMTYRPEFRLWNPDQRRQPALPETNPPVKDDDR